MSSFKQRPNKLKYRSDATTVPEIHATVLANFKTNSQSIPYKKRQIANIKEQLNNNKKLTLNEKSKMLSQIKNLEYEIFHTDENSELLEYASKTADYLINYYEVTSSVYYNSNDVVYDHKSDQNTNSAQNTNDNINQNTNDNINQNINENINKNINENINKNINDNSNPKTKSKIDKLYKLHEESKQNRKVKKEVKRRKAPETTPTSKSILFFLPTQPESDNSNSNQNNSINSTNSSISDQNNFILNKATILHKYRMAIDKEYACGKIKADKIIFCPDCKINKGKDIEKTSFQSEGCYICRECGHTQYVIMESEIPSHKEMANEKQKYPYKKINHLKEKLNQFQSKESADVSDEICSTVKSDLRKMGIDCRRVTPPIIRKILKKHKWTNCYEHLQQIYCKVSGNKPINLSTEIEETIINMFQSMQESFRKHCPKHRSNFLSYSYVLNKIFRILGMPEHAKYFGLLKSKEKLREQDAIWNKICKDRSWEFYSSF